MSSSHQHKAIVYLKPSLSAKLENYAKQMEVSKSKVLVQAVEKLLAEKK
jgi:hypothetical protein